jgi:hypothetical protein
MKNFLAFLGAAIIVFLGLGWYLGWYNVLLRPGDSGHSKLEVDINKQKIGSDVKTGVQKGSEKVQEFLDKNKQSPDTSKEKTASTEKESTNNVKPVSDPKTPQKRAEEGFKDFIIDGWLGGDKK